MCIRSSSGPNGVKTAEGPESDACTTELHSQCVRQQSLSQTHHNPAAVKHRYEAHCRHTDPDDEHLDDLHDAIANQRYPQQAQGPDAYGHQKKKVLRLIGEGIRI